MSDFNRHIVSTKKIFRKCKLCNCSINTCDELTSGYCNGCLQVSKDFFSLFNIPIEFIVDNLPWLRKMNEKTQTDWFGSISISIQSGEPKTVRWQETEKIK